MKTVSKALIFFLVIGLAFTACDKVKKENETKQEVSKEETLDTDHQEAGHDHGNEMAQEVYQCPMKCEGEKTYHKEGSCPVCKMKLKKVEVASSEAPAKEVHEE